LEKQGEDTDFVAGPHKWATYVNRHLVTNKDGTRHYLRFIVRSRKEFWYLDSKPVQPTMFEEWIKQVPKETIQYRNFGIDNILSFKYRKVMHVVTERKPFPVT